MRFDFKIGSGIAIGSECYRFVERVRDHQRSPVFRHIGTDEPRMIPDRELKKLIEKSEIKFLTPEEMFEAEATGEAPKGPEVVFLDDIQSEWERKRVERLEKYARGWDRAGRPAQSDAKLFPVIARVADEEGDGSPPRPRTLRRFLKTWVAQGCTLGSLLSRKNQCGAKLQINPSVREIVLDVIWDEYLTLQRPSVVDCHETIKRRIAEANTKLLAGTPKLKVPEIKQVYREIKKIDRFTVMASREGVREAMLKFGPRYAGIELKKHNARWELDSTVADLMLIDTKSGQAIGRPTITVVIDCYTRTIVGFYIGWEAESFVTFVAAMKNALQSKSYIHELYPSIKHTWENLGPAEYVAVDNHSAYVSEDAKQALASLGMDIQYTPVLKPWWRPIIERFFNTLTHKTFQRVPGTTFSNIFERNDETPPESIAVCTLEELREVVTAWIVDEYHYTPHRGIKTMPAFLLEESMRLHPTAPPPSMDRMNTALSIVVERVPQHYGIEWEGLLYNSPAVGNVAIAPGGSRKVRIAVDASDLTSIQMHDPGRGEWIRIPLEKPKLPAGTVLTYAQHSLAKQLLKTRTEEFAGPESYRAARDYVARYVESKRDAKSMAERRRGARFEFQERPKNVVPAVVDKELSAKPVSDSIFGGSAEMIMPPTPLNQPAPAMPDSTGTDDAEQAAPDPIASSAPADRGQRAHFVPEDEDIDLDAEAARLGIQTHKE